MLLTACIHPGDDLAGGSFHMGHLDYPRTILVSLVLVLAEEDSGGVYCVGFGVGLARVVDADLGLR